ncbi:MAG TPA: DUF2203 family protein [Thermoanaerobaculia bacterium]|nr:DUF2203 family protein [Thermoanaerobaculia bacterium]
MSDKKLFSYEDACALLPEVQRLTDSAYTEVEALGEEVDETNDDFRRIVTDWAEQVLALGIEVKGLWLVDFDSGSGYYCWHHPEPSLQFFHGYEEGFRGRVQLN